MSDSEKTPLEADEAKLRNPCSPSKLIALTVIICGLVRFAVVDPLGIASIGVPCRHGDNARHTVVFQFKPNVSPSTVDAVGVAFWANRYSAFR